jgi:hypothetical protein
MKIKRWDDFLFYIKETKSIKDIEFWKIDEDSIIEYFQESIDEGYKIEVDFGFVGDERIWDSKEQRTIKVERFTKKILSGNIQPAISIIITGDNVSDNDVSENLKFAYDIISEKVDSDIVLLFDGLESAQEVVEIDGIIAKDGLFYIDPSNPENKPEEAGNIEFFVKQKEEVKITQLELAQYYNWSSYEVKGDSIFVDYSLEDLADELLTRDDRFKSLLIRGEEGEMSERYYGGDYQPDLISLFEYYLDKDNKILLVKALIKETGGLKQFVDHIGDECDDMIYDEVKVMMEDKEGEPETEKEERKINDITDYLLKERFYKTLEQISKDSEILSDIKQSYGDWAANAHADVNLKEIRAEFDEILDNNFKYEKGRREVEIKSKHKDENGNSRTYKVEETFYLIQFSNDWLEDFDFDYIEGESLTTIFEEYCGNNELTRHVLEPNFSDYGDVDDKAWNKDVKSDLLRFLK